MVRAAFGKSPDAKLVPKKRTGRNCNEGEDLQDLRRKYFYIPSDAILPPLEAFAHSTPHENEAIRRQSNGTKRLVAERGTLNGGKVRDCVKKRLKSGTPSAVLNSDLHWIELDYITC